MPSSDSALERVTFDVLRRSNEIVSVTDLNALFAPAFEALGFPHFGAFGHVRTDLSDDLEVLFGQPDAAWYRHYRSFGLAGSDPRLRHMLRSAKPAWLSDLAKGDGCTPSARQFLEAIHAFGHRESYVWPLHYPDAPVQGVILLGVGGDYSPDHEVAAAALAQGYHLAGAKLLWSHLRAVDAASVELRPRQIECLALARHGNSSAVIGQILGISARTVDEHLANAAALLGVRTRVQAVALAVKLGLI